MPREGERSEVKRAVVFTVNVSTGNELDSFALCLFFSFSKLQSELRTTNLEELKITVESYLEEVTQQLHHLLPRGESREARVQVAFA